MSTVSGTSTATQDIIASLNRAGTASATQTSTTDSTRSQFLTLLTTQLKNQDPMNPLDNAQVTSQLAQLSTVDGIERLNGTLNQIMAGQQTSEAMQAAALVGHGVLVPGKGLVLSDSGALGGFTLENPADKVTVTITDSNGLQVAAVDLGEFDAGTHTFEWDGTAADGSRAANGKYTITVKAQTDGEAVGAEALQLGAVSSVVRGTQGTDLQVGALGIFKLSEIKQIL
jgi:flagellar basal-body rod modification protein FlgD